MRGVLAEHAVVAATEIGKRIKYIKNTVIIRKHYIIKFQLVA